MYAHVRTHNGEHIIAKWYNLVAILCQKYKKYRKLFFQTWNEMKKKNEIGLEKKSEWKKSRQELSKRWQSQLKDVKITTIEFRCTYNIHYRLCDTYIFILPCDGNISIMCLKLWDEFNQFHSDIHTNAALKKIYKEWMMNFSRQYFRFCAWKWWCEWRDTTNICFEVGMKFYVLYL